jgi:RNA transcription, translation and transport factor protein
VTSHVAPLQHNVSSGDCLLTVFIGFFTSMINNGDRQRNRGNGGGRRGSGRGGRGRGGRTSSKAKNNKTTTNEASAHAQLIEKQKSTGTTTSSGADMSCWIISALKTLGHTSPGEKGNIYDDGVFQEIVVFLEDRCIRLWDLDQRNATIRQTSNFLETHLATYLKATGCPWSYDENVPEQRYRVLHWLICYAMQEVYHDAFERKDDDDEAHPPFTTTDAHAPMAASPSYFAGTTSFPLGFSTGDDQVDAVLTLMRMQMVVDMQEHQHVINERIISAAEANHQVRS